MAESKERPWGKINRKQPYVVITRDLLRAFFHAKMNPAERSLFGHVLEHSWGDATRGKKAGAPWPDALPCEINLYDLATAWNIDYSNLKKALKSLISDRLILCSDGRHFINKDVDTWADSRITQEFLEHAAEAIRTGTVPGPDSYPLGVYPTPKSMQLGVNHTPNDPRCNGMLGVSPTPTVPPHIGTRAELDSIQREEEKSQVIRAAPTAEDFQEPDGLEPFESAPDARPLPSENGTGSKIPGALDRALDVARETWPDAHQLHRAIINRKDGHPAAWYLPAVLILGRKKRQQQTLSYFLGILRRFKDQGGPDDISDLSPFKAATGPSMPILTAPPPHPKDKKP